jgi:RNA polymerase sigma factor (sigma-70 family)
MTRGSVSPVLRLIRKLGASSDLAHDNDGLLLERFARMHDGLAFAALVRRHAPLVLSVCRRILQHEQDAEDAFQGTFLVLARRAGSIRKPESLGSWLYGVALRVATRAKRERAGLPATGVDCSTFAAPETMSPIHWREYRAALEEEIGRLPERYRLPFVLCYLEGRTNEQAARQLGCPPGTVFSRLARARRLLGRRLGRRGVSLTAGLGITWLAKHSAAAIVPEFLVEQTIRVSLVYAVNPAAATGWICAQVMLWAQGVQRAMLISKLKVCAMVVLATAVTGAGAIAWAQRTATEPIGESRHEALSQAERKAADKLHLVIRIPSRKDGVVLLVGTDIKQGEQVPRDRLVIVKSGQSDQLYRRLRRGDMIEEGQLLARLDDTLARSEIAIMEAKVGAAIADRLASEKTRDEAKKRFEQRQRLVTQNLGLHSLEDLRGAELTYWRYVYETKSKAEAVTVAEQELAQAKLKLAMYEIRSPRRGVLQTIYKHAGEGIHYLEPAFALQVPAEE